MITLGAMSGTSTDGIDVAALDWIGGRFRFLGLHSAPFPDNLKNPLLNLQELPWVPVQADIDPLTFLFQTRRELSLAYANASRTLMESLGLKPSDVRAIGVHGQTLRHRPDLGFTYQMIDPALLASALGVDVVSDFRAKDVALGGQGAPLVPAFHEALLQQGSAVSGCAVLNLGGFANVTLLRPEGVLGGDCGPANVLMDQWVRTHFAQDWDHEGKIARSGQVIEPLLSLMLAHPFFQRSWPKSTGRDEFTPVWLQSCLDQAGCTRSNPRDVLCTLTELTAQSVAECLRQATLSDLWVCGGGVFNTFLMERLRACMGPAVRVGSSKAIGMEPMAMEASAFAWLAARHVQGLPGNCIGVTGASRAAVLGSLSPHA